MKPEYLIWGAGAIGGTVGAYLAREGYRITFVDVVHEHVKVINEHGLSIVGPIDQFKQHIPAFLPDNLKGTYKNIILCVKAHHTMSTIQTILPFLADDGHVISFQNGLNELNISSVIGKKRTIGAFVNFGADYMEPGIIHYGGRGAVALGELDGVTTPRIKALHEAMLLFEPKSVLTDNIMGYLWGKMGYGAQLFATAVTNDSIADVLDNQLFWPFMTELTREVMRAAKAYDVQPIGFNGFDPDAFSPNTSTPEAIKTSFQQMVIHNRKSAKTHSGIWRDLAIRKRPTEVDAQMGHVAKLASEKQIQTPLIKKLVAMIHEIEEEKRPLSINNLKELNEFMEAK